MFTWGSLSAWPRLSQNCSAVWDSSCRSLFPTLLSWMWFLPYGREVLHDCSCSLSLFCFYRCFSLVLAHLNLSCICFSEFWNWHILVNHTQRGTSLKTSKITWPECNETFQSRQSDFRVSLLLIISFPLSKLRTPWEEGDWNVDHVLCLMKWNCDGFVGCGNKKIMASLAGYSSQLLGA